MICPEQSVTAYIRKLIEYPEALQVLEFAHGLVSLIAVRAVAGGPLVQHSLAEIPQLVPGIDMRIVAIYRHDKALTAAATAARASSPATRSSCSPPPSTSAPCWARCARWTGRCAA